MCKVCKFLVFPFLEIPDIKILMEPFEHKSESVFMKIVVKTSKEFQNGLSREN